LQRLSSEDSLWLSLQGQHSSKNLDSSERFTLGGAQGIRAYPTAEGAGDHGWTFTLEERRTLTPQWQGVLFYDFGRIRVNHQAYTGANGPEHVTLKGGGLSLNYSLPGRGMLRLTWARRISDNPLASDKTGLDTDGSLVRNRIWLSLNAFL
jgi:hemolysin activation/secretion protein